MPNSFRRDYPVTWSILLFVLGCKDKNSKIQNEIFWREHGALWECDPRWNTEIMNANVLSESSKAFIGARRHYRDKTTATHSYPHPREIPLSPSCPHLLTVTPFCSVPTGWEADVSVWSWIYPDPWSGYCYLRPPETSCQEQTARSAPGRRHVCEGAIASRVGEGATCIKQANVLDETAPFLLPSRQEGVWFLLSLPGAAGLASQGGRALFMELE